MDASRNDSVSGASYCCPCTTHSVIKRSGITTEDLKNRETKAKTQKKAKKAKPKRTATPTLTKGANPKIAAASSARSAQASTAQSRIGIGTIIKPIKDTVVDPIVGGASGGGGVGNVPGLGQLESLVRSQFADVTNRLRKLPIDAAGQVPPAIMRAAGFAHPPPQAALRVITRASNEVVDQSANLASAFTQFRNEAEDILNPATFRRAGRLFHGFDELADTVEDLAQFDRIVDTAKSLSRVGDTITSGDEGAKLRDDLALQLRELRAAASELNNALALRGLVPLPPFLADALLDLADDARADTSFEKLLNDAIAAAPEELFGVLANLLPTAALTDLADLLTALPKQLSALPTSSTAQDDEVQRRTDEAEASHQTQSAAHAKHSEAARQAQEKLDQINDELRNMLGLGSGVRRTNRASQAWLTNLQTQQALATEPLKKHSAAAEASTPEHLNAARARQAAMHSVPASSRVNAALARAYTARKTGGGTSSSNGAKTAADDGHDDNLKNILAILQMSVGLAKALVSVVSDGVDVAIAAIPFNVSIGKHVEASGEAGGGGVAAVANAFLKFNVGPSLGPGIQVNSFSITGTLGGIIKMILAIVGHILDIVATIAGFFQTAPANVRSFLEPA